MTKTPPIHEPCGQPMTKRGKRPGTVIQRWYCAACEKWGVDRGSETHLGKKMREVAPRVMVGVAHGMSVHAIALVCGTDWMTVARRIKRAAAEVKKRLKTESPRVSKRWFLVDLPAGCHTTGKAAVVQSRSTYRLLAWESGPNAVRLLQTRLGCHPSSVAAGSPEQAWLERAVGNSAKNWGDAEDRLRIILAHSNGWELGKNLDV